MTLIATSTRTGTFTDCGCGQHEFIVVLLEPRRLMPAVEGRAIRYECVIASSTAAESAAIGLATHLPFALYGDPTTAHPEGVEPPTYGSEVRCSIQLSYGCVPRCSIVPPQRAVKRRRQELTSANSSRHSAGDFCGAEASLRRRWRRRVTRPAVATVRTAPAGQRREASPVRSGQLDFPFWAVESPTRESNTGVLPR